MEQIESEPQKFHGIGGYLQQIKFKLHNDHSTRVVYILVGPEILLFGSLVDHSEPDAMVPIANPFLAIHMPQCRLVASICRPE